jgi:hypothetical protein
LTTSLPKKKSKGNCRYNKPLGLCTKHQIRCRGHDLVHLKDEHCPNCFKQSEKESEKEEENKPDKKSDKKSDKK